MPPDEGQNHYSPNAVKIKPVEDVWLLCIWGRNSENCLIIVRYYQGFWVSSHKLYSNLMVPTTIHVSATCGYDQMQHNRYIKNSHFNAMSNKLYTCVKLQIMSCLIKCLHEYVLSLWCE
jgi:hypothetical protein